MFVVNQMANETFFEADPSSERYAYVLSAGFALGLINLCNFTNYMFLLRSAHIVGKGRELEQVDHPFAIGHLRFHERLFVLLNGGHRELCVVDYQLDPCAVAQRGACSCGMSRADQKFEPSQHQHHHRQRADLGGISGSAAGESCRV